MFYKIMFIFLSLFFLIIMFSKFNFNNNDKVENLGKFQYSLIDFKSYTKNEKQILFYQMRLFDKNALVENTVKNCVVSKYLDKGDQFFFETERVTNENGFYYRALGAEKVFCDNK